MPEISVLIPAYNVGEFIGRCLDSVIGQSFRDIEIIVVEDGSTDGTPAVIEEYAARDPRIMVIRHPGNCGLLWARKTGIEASSGRFIMFLDSDDELMPDACGKLYSEAVRTGADLVIAGHDSIGTDGAVTPVYNALKYGDSSYGLAMAMARGDVVAYVWSKLYRRELFTSHPAAFLKDHTYGEDLILSFHAARYVHQVVVISDRLYRYYQNPASVTHIFPSDKELDSDLTSRIISIGYAGEIDGRVKERLETNLIRRFHVWIKKGVSPAKVRQLADSHGVGNLLSFSELRNHLGTRKGISYYLATHSGFYPWLLYGRGWKR